MADVSRLDGQTHAYTPKTMPPTYVGFQLIPGMGRIRTRIFSRDPLWCDETLDDTWDSSALDNPVRQNPSEPTRETVAKITATGQFLLTPHNTAPCRVFPDDYYTLPISTALSEPPLSDSIMQHMLDDILDHTTLDWTEMSNSDQMMAREPYTCMLPDLTSPAFSVEPPTTPTRVWSATNSVCSPTDQYTTGTCPVINDDSNWSWTVEEPTSVPFGIIAHLNLPIIFRHAPVMLADIMRDLDEGNYRAVDGVDRMFVPVAMPPPTAENLRAIADNYKPYIPVGFGGTDEIIPVIIPGVCVLFNFDRCDRPPVTVIIFHA